MRLQRRKFTTKCLHHHKKIESALNTASFHVHQGIRDHLVMRLQQTDSFNELLMQ